ncbi:hypothetical protein FRC10_002993 [Ceratobasidium sp. 414]|nr:hypothetical protein FRC10_002993 [Ceratobasidium sp. 414]
MHNTGESSPNSQPTGHQDHSRVGGDIVLLSAEVADPLGIQSAGEYLVGEESSSIATPMSKPTHYPSTRSYVRQLRIGYREECDAFPEAPAPLPSDTSSLTSSLSLSSSRYRLPRKHIRFVPFETNPDSFGRYRIYISKPSTIPDSKCISADFYDRPSTVEEPTQQSYTSTPPLSEVIFPCPNLTTFHFLHWFWKGTSKSQASRKDLQRVLLQPDFNPRDLSGVNLGAIDDKLAASVYSELDKGSFRGSDGWTEKSVTVQVPLRGKNKAGQSATVPISGLHSRKILAGVRKAFFSNNVKQFHYEPFESRYLPPGASKSESQVISDEIYTSPAMLEAHKDVQRLEIEDSKCTHPRVVAAIMLGSDATQLGAFSTKKAWMLYMWLGNLSKYERGKPSSKSCFDLAHIPSLPDSIKDIIAKLDGRAPSSALLTHLRRELMHAILLELLDDEFLHAWRHGIVIKCADGITRRVFPRIFTYSADYPERVLLATIRDKGRCPCPRCLIPMNQVHKMGMRSDASARVKTQRHDNLKRQKLINQARSLIYEGNKVVSNTEVEDLLQPTSLVPTQNAFSQRLLPLNFDFHKMFVVDLLHEVELGVWKSLFMHLVRILYMRGPDTVVEFNRRFRLVPTFCNSTIRKFSEDVASMKRLAARDFEDILQCCISVFKGLLPDTIDAQAQQLLFTFAYWHALAKLRQHTDTTLHKLKLVTSKLGDAMRTFKNSTVDLEVLETPHEFSARQRRAAAQAQQRSSSASQVQISRKRCELNLNTFKFHSLGDYAPTISQLGTTDSFSTQTIELQHRKPKAQWERTNMREAIPQMVRIGDIGDALDTIAARLNKLEHAKDPPQDTSSNDMISRNPYWIGQTDRTDDAINIPLWVDTHSQDCAVKFFIPSLKEHLLSRIPGNHQPTDLGKITFQNDRMYSHATLQINYTSYDVRRQQDTLNPHTPCRFILLPADTGGDLSVHPFLYAKVLGIYHANIRYCHRPPKRMDFVWVRWLDYDHEEPGGWDIGRLDRVSYCKYRNDSELLDAFGFIDPRNIIRASHMIPDFSSGMHCTVLNAKAKSLAYDSDEGDWKYYYASRFVDRDMFMRYLGGGIGHYNQTALASTGGEVGTSYEMEDSDLEEMDVGGMDVEGPRPEHNNHNGGRGDNDDDQEEDIGEELWGADESDAGSEFAASEGEGDDFVEDLYEL